MVFQLLIEIRGRAWCPPSCQKPLFISFFQLADAFRKQYYKTFSWDTFTGNNNEQMHEKMYRMYDEQLEKKDRTIESLTNENMLLKEKIRKNEDVVHSEKTKKEKKLNH